MKIPTSRNKRILNIGGLYKKYHTFFFSRKINHAVFCIPFGLVYCTVPKISSSGEITQRVPQTTLSAAHFYAACFSFRSSFIFLAGCQMLFAQTNSYAQAALILDFWSVQQLPILHNSAENANLNWNSSTYGLDLKALVHCLIVNLSLLILYKYS